MGRAARNPAEADLALLEDILRRLARLERRRPKAIRFDLDNHAHAIIGVQDDGSVGLKLYDHTGALAASYTTS